MTYKSLIKNSDAANLVLLLALLVSIGLLVGYIRANRSLVVQAEVLKNQAEAFEIRSGDFWPPLSAVNGSGATVPLISGDSQLVLVESKACRVCSDMQPQWTLIANEAAQEHCRVRAISLDPIVAVHSQVKESFEVLQLKLPSEFTRAARIDKIPALVMVSPTGRVDWVHIGLVDDRFAKVITNRLASSCRHE